MQRFFKAKNFLDIFSEVLKNLNGYSRTSGKMNSLSTIDEDRYSISQEDKEKIFKYYISCFYHVMNYDKSSIIPIILAYFLNKENYHKNFNKKNIHFK